MAVFHKKVNGRRWRLIFYLVNFFDMEIPVATEENRIFSFTNKRSAYYYATTHSPENTMWFAGWNVAGKRLLSDYQLWNHGQLLNRADAKVVVRPAEIKRDFGQLHEVFTMVDHQDILVFVLDGSDAAKGIRLSFNLLYERGFSQKGVFYTPHESQDKVILLSSIQDEILSKDGDIVIGSPGGSGFVLIYATTEQEAWDKLNEFRINYTQWIAERATRIDGVIKKYILSSNDKDLDKALPWIGLTLDSLITNQQGLGIYAGLPWFNQYWGRDQFISFPGACLISGDFAIAKEIMLNFAKFQNIDPDSKYFGRIPNRAQPEQILYNTTDGTPRFVIQVWDYLLYSGDTSIIQEIFPAIKRSIEGSLKYWVDEDGYLTHEEADTWMDAKREGRPCSPRGDRANDVQSLWVQQLVAGAWLAQFVRESTLAEVWQELADKVKQNFRRDFFNEHFDFMADRLTASGEPDFRMRPNQLYAFELLEDEFSKAKIASKVWESLVYPWGVASLSQDDPEFHPYHEHWEFYHKDDAYHNGTVWLWNNGMAMQRMIEAGQKDVAFELFKNMNGEALRIGAVGSLAENSDALPLPGASWVRLTGAFLQAWSNAEHLRIWYQYFLGVRPNMIKNLITLNPNIPTEIKDLSTTTTAGSAAVRFEYKSTIAANIYTYDFTDYEGAVSVMISNFSAYKLSLKVQTKLSIIEKPDQLTIEIQNKNESELINIQPDDKKTAQQRQIDALFKDIHFAKPCLNPELKALKKL